MATQTTAVTNAKPSPLATVHGLLEKYKGQIAVALPKHMTAERMIRVALTAMSQNPGLLECNPLTVCGAVVQASILGLEPNSVLGECYLVPFWNKNGNGGKGGKECQLIVGYQGKIKLMANTGGLLGVNAKPVHQNDEFDFDDGLTPHVHHRYHHIADRGPVIGFWGGVALKSSFNAIAYMTVKEVEAHRDQFAMTKTKDRKIFGVWHDNFEAMALKTVIHRAAKYVPKSALAQSAWANDERAEVGIPQQFSVDIPMELQPSGAFEDPNTAEPQPTIQAPQRASEAGKSTPEKFGTLLDQEQAKKGKEQTDADSPLSDEERAVLDAKDREEALAGR